MKGVGSTTQEALLAALRRLLANGGEMPLWGRGPTTGLFPSKTATARKTIEQLRAAGWIAISEPLTEKATPPIVADGGQGAKQRTDFPAADRSERTPIRGARPGTEHPTDRPAAESTAPTLGCGSGPDTGRLGDLAFAENTACAIDRSARPGGAHRAERAAADTLLCTITAAGRDHLFASESPRLLLEDLLRATESEAEVLHQLRAACGRHLELLERRSADIRATLGRLEGFDPALAAAIEHALKAHQQSGRPGATSLAELYRSLTAADGKPSIGQFHDCLRSLHRAGTIRLAPWTGPLYQLPQPQLGLLIGHEVLYYVDLARANAA